MNFMIHIMYYNTLLLQDEYKLKVFRSQCKSDFEQSSYLFISVASIVEGVVLAAGLVVTFFVNL